MKRAIAAAGVALLGAAHAGHEFPFYPSFYPQEITIEALDAAAAARRLGDGTLHAYAGSAIPDSGKTAAVNSLGGYVVAMTQAGGCIDARGMKEALAPGQVWHPYPVTPFHPDYLHHADRVEAAGAAQASPAAKVEIVDVDALMAKARKGYNGWSEPPWIRQGWFHAYLLLAPPAPDSDIENAVRRLMLSFLPICGEEVYRDDNARLFRIECRASAAAGTADRVGSKDLQTFPPEGHACLDRRRVALDSEEACRL